MIKRFVRSTVVALCLISLTADLVAQDQTLRILEQDSALNNLVDPVSYETGELGALGRVEKAGQGPISMILIAGAGFGGEIFEPLLEGKRDIYTTYSVTLPGFGNTPAPPTPSEDTSFGQQTWTTGAVTGIERLIESEQIDDVVLVGHWMTGTQVAMRLALKHPDRVRGVILLAGTAKFGSDGRSLEARVQGVDAGLAPRWFKTVTPETWDDNNFMPSDYVTNPIVGLRLWRQAARPPLHVWVRYLCEFHAQDIAGDLEQLAVPTLLLRPGLEGVYYEGEANYLEAYLHTSWETMAAAPDRFRTATIPNTRIVMWRDEPEAVGDAITTFLDEIGGLE